MIDYLADTVFKSWKTTAIALVVFGLITALGVTSKVEWEKLYGWYGTAFTLLFVADPKILKKAKEAADNA